MEHVKHTANVNKPVALRHPIEAVGIKYSLLGAAVMIVYFVIMRMMNLIQYPELRFINYLILAVVIYFGLKEERRLEHHKRLNYLPGIGTGFMIGSLTALFFGIFVFIYSKLDGSFVRAIADNNPFTHYINAYTVGALVFSETFIFGAIAAFVLMQLFKRNRVSTGR